MNTIKSNYITAYKNGTHFLGHVLDVNYMDQVLEKQYPGIARIQTIENVALGLHRFYVDGDGNYYEIREEQR